MCSNFDSIKTYIQDLNKPFDVIAISETWLNEHVNIKDYSIDNYQLYNTNRTSKRGGGVLLYVLNNYEVELITQMSLCVDDILESITVEIQIPNTKNIMVSCMYRPPGGNIEIFNEHLQILLDSVKHKNYILCGDMNINLLNTENHTGTRMFLDLMYTYGLYPLINKPTRITLGCSTLIDNIFSNILCKSKSGVLINDISDHLPIFCCIEYGHVTKPTAKVYKYIRKISNADMKAIQNDLVEHDWSTIYNEQDVNKAYAEFNDIIKQTYDMHCPRKKMRIDNKKKANKPWLTNSLIKCCKQKLKLYKRFINNKNESNEKKFKNYRNRLTTVLKFSEKKYYNDLLNLHKGNIKETWKVLNNIIKKKKGDSNTPKHFIKENNEKIINGKEISDGFNNFFSNIGPKLAEQIETPADETIYDYLRNPIENSMFLSPIVEADIINIVNNFKSKTSNDCDNIDMALVKNIIKFIATPLTHICNLSFSSGIFPDLMKMAKIIPLYKAGGKSQFTNYRPVSLLPQFSKILERLFNNRLNNFIEKNNVISESQYGFRANRSTSSALMDLIEQITDNLDNKQITIGIFIDLKKAFDTVNHQLLIKKLRYYGVRGKANTWLQSYLDNRKQFVYFNDHCSEANTVKCGVPQGSILGPLLFIIYINDIVNVSDLLKFVLFADDTNLFASGNNIKSLCSMISGELEKLNTWFCVNKLSLNLTKTSFMVFTNKSISNVSLFMCNTEIERVAVTKFLGVIIDDKLTWKEHIKQLSSKLAKCGSVIFKASSLLDSESLRTLYNSMFLPYISYCAEIWGNTYKSNLQCIIRAQKRIVRIIGKVHRFEHTNLLFHRFSILKFNDLVRLKISLIVHKAKQNLLPPNLQKRFMVYDENAKYTLRSLGKFKICYVRTTKKSKCISIEGIKIYNLLPTSVKSVVNTTLFKKRFKKEVFNVYLAQGI